MSKDCDLSVGEMLAIGLLQQFFENDCDADKAIKSINDRIESLNEESRKEQRTWFDHGSLKGGWVTRDVEVYRCKHCGEYSMEFSDIYCKKCGHRADTSRTQILEVHNRTIGKYCCSHNIEQDKLDASAD